MAAVESKSMVLQTVRRWSIQERLAFVQEVLRSVQEEGDETTGPLRPTLPRALGLAASERPAPSDEEVARWLEEHREAKYR